MWAGAVGETIKDVAVELALDWHTVKALDMQYMEAQLKRAGSPGPQVIGVDEIDPQRSHLPDRGQRPSARPADLVCGEDARRRA